MVKSIMLFLQVMDDVVNQGSTVLVKAGDGFISVNNTLKIRNSFLYTLDGQWTTYGPLEKYLYVGLNRVPYGNFRAGSGLCHVRIRVDRSKGKYTPCWPVGKTDL